MAVDLHIEELVLHGFAAHDRHRIAAAVQLELSRLMGESGISGSEHKFVSQEWMNGESFKVKAGAEPESAGAQIAQVIFASLRQQTRAPVRQPVARAGAGGPHA